MNTTTTMISTGHPRADFLIAHTLLRFLNDTPAAWKDFVFFCIGTPQISGDALGPIVGSRLEKLHLPHAFVYGTLKKPIHALNLAVQLETVKKKHPDSCFIAIDASFGPESQLGNFFIENRPLHPGQGVGKMLPPVGDVSITDVVCTNCSKRCQELQAVPLSRIKTHANTMISGIFLALFYHRLISRSKKMSKHPIDFY